ncbi:amidase [Siculibacillus lacustris]|uniref:Amidase n=1 Tax=Siculibacillus lacustris TaxID=1549641 RepID=A0A4Q9VXW0_9HYPH|nr:amidase [Siculibacillus lacustris]TBW41346.1 amidase [Siculibacillus lacustris]
MNAVVPPPNDALAALSARETARRVAAGDLAAEAVCRAFVQRIADGDAALGAWAHVDAERALEAARAVDRSGPLAGVTFGVKDVIDTADMPTEYGSAAYAGVRPVWDAPIVALTRRFGGVVLGKTVTTEFAMASPGPTRNPVDPAHTPGGSSSGSCAAVAAGMVHAAFGTQTSGSLIRPASYCGVVGYKPTFGVLNRTAVKVLSDSLDTLGVVTRDVRDAAFVTAALAERPGLAVAERVAPPRVGLFRTSRWALAEPATRAALDRTVAALAAAGVEVRDVAVPEWFEGLWAAHDAVMGWETPRSLAYERDRLGDRLTAVTRRFLDTLAATTFADYTAARDVARGRRDLLDELLSGCDVLITPAAPGEAPLGLGATGDPVFNKVWTLLHGPCLSLPAGRGPAGLPVGVQIVGRIGADADLLAAAAFIEQALAAVPPVARG